MRVIAKLVEVPNDRELWRRWGKVKVSSGSGGEEEEAEAFEGEEGDEEDECD